jgi:hypothetical protein
MLRKLSTEKNMSLLFLAHVNHKRPCFLERKIAVVPKLFSSGKDFDFAMAQEKKNRENSVY